jgi:outer membrane protein insertion porin family/translocation and assembly module TamA
VSYFFPDFTHGTVAHVRLTIHARWWITRGILGLACVAPASLHAQDEGLVVKQLKFEGNKSIESATLAASIATSNSSWLRRSALTGWIGTGARKYFDDRELQRDVLRLEVLYRRSGFPSAVVDTLVRRDSSNAWITFRITEGLPILLQQLEFTGLDSLEAQARREVTQDLPLRIGKPFNISLLQATIDTVGARLRNRGYPLVDIFREFQSDSATLVASATLNIETGRHYAFGRITVTGSDKVDTADVRSLLVLHEGRPYSERDITASQLNLYRSDLFSLAAVSFDSAAFNPADSLIPVIVRVGENRTYRVRSGVGYATNDCFRGSAGLTVRNFLGSAKVFDISARMSKIGVGQPLDWGFQNNLCRALLVNDSLEIGSRKLNYNVTVSVRRPGFLAPNVAVTVSGFSERRSEFNVYLREDLGAAISTTRESPVRRDPITLAYSFSYGATFATDAAFCSFFSVCTPDVRAIQQLRKPIGILSLAAAQPRVNNLVYPTRGQVLSAEAAVSSTLIGSSSFQQFTRFVGEARFYRTVVPDVVLAWRVRAGRIFGRGLQDDGLTSGSNFVPIEQRFYAGGPNDVRGFGFNQLGPLTYVSPDSSAVFNPDGSVNTVFLEQNSQVFPVGGNGLLLGNVEVRVPAPVWSSRLRLAAFLDVGGVFQFGSNAQAENRIVATPGVGVRFNTPVGPFRLDAAYNWNRLEQGPVYITRANGDLDALIDPVTGDPYTLSPVRRRGWQLNLTVGQPF